MLLSQEKIESKPEIASFSPSLSLRDSGIYNANSNSSARFAIAKQSLLFLLKQTAQLLKDSNEINFEYPAQCQLLKGKQLGSVISHLQKLRERIDDVHSRIIVTGDLNAGKSTFVNTLLKRQIVPDDQEPCTALFVEVVDAVENEGIEEVHCIDEPFKYDRKDPSTYKKIDVEMLRDEVENDEPQYNLLKVYCKNKQNTLLNNGLIRTSLIDSPGLNIDSLKTTSLFAKQEEIDVIVFLVNAENHFTLSAKEFLETAMKEKQYVFIVVNRFDSIKRKERNKKEILEQIKAISESTFNDSENLVHFVSCKNAFEIYTGIHRDDQDNDWVEKFENLTQKLSCFVFDKRMKSKLAPAKLYINNIFLDLDYILESNLQSNYRKQENLLKIIHETEPKYKKLLELQKEYLQELTYKIDSAVQRVEKDANVKLNEFLKEFELFLEAVEWKGILNIFEYTKELRAVIGKLASLRLGSSIQFSKDIIAQELANAYKVANEHLSEPLDYNIDGILAVLEPPNSSNLIMANHSAFDNSDQFDLLKDYIPSISIVSVGLLGYRSSVTGILRFSGSSFSKSTKLLFTGCIMAGLTLFAFKCSDIQKGIQQKMYSKLVLFFTESNFVAFNAQSIKVFTEKALRSGFNDFQQKFSTALSSKQQVYTETKQQNEELNENIDLIQGFKQRLKELQQDLSKVNLSE